MSAAEVTHPRQRASMKNGMGSQGKILVVSHDPKLADVRKRILEKAGYSVVQAADASAAEEVCMNDGIKLIMLGYSPAPAEKRQVWAASRRHCNLPILELHRRAKPELVERNVFAHESHLPDDFLESVRCILAG